MFHLHILTDLIEINKEVSGKTLTGLKACPLLFPITAGVLIANVLAGSLAVLFGILGGIFMLIANGVILGAYLYALESVVRFKRLRLEDLRHGVQVYFRRVVIMAMIVSMCLYVASLAAGILGLGLLALLAYLAAFVLLNPLPEMLYQKHWSEGECLSRSAEFIRENWLEWFVLLTPMMLLAFGGGFLLGLVVPGAGFFAGLLVQALVLPFVMLYRGHLFDLLSKTSRRKRMFMRKMN